MQRFGNHRLLTNITLEKMQVSTAPNADNTAVDESRVGLSDKGTMKTPLVVQKILPSQVNAVSPPEKPPRKKLTERKMTIQVPSITELELDSTLQNFFRPDLGLATLNEALLNEKCLQTDVFKVRSPSINPFGSMMRDEKGKDNSQTKVVSLFPPLRQRQISPRY